MSALTSTISTSTLTLPHTGAYIFNGTINNGIVISEEEIKICDEIVSEIYEIMLQRSEIWEIIKLQKSLKENLYEIFITHKNQLKNIGVMFILSEDNINITETTNIHLYTGEYPKYSSFTINKSVFPRAFCLSCHFSN